MKAEDIQQLARSAAQPVAGGGYDVQWLMRDKTLGSVERGLDKLQEKVALSGKPPNKPMRLMARLWPFGTEEE